MEDGKESRRSRRSSRTPSARNRENPDIEMRPPMEVGVKFRGQTENPKDIESTFVITNFGESNLAYKILCNAPAKYAVSPSVGVLQPKGSKTLNCHLRKGCWSEESSDKFLVLTTVVSDFRPDFREIFRNVPRPDVYENRLPIHCVPPSDDNAGPGSCQSVELSQSIGQESRDIEDIVAKLREVMAKGHLGQRARTKLTDFLKKKLTEANISLDERRRSSQDGDVIIVRHNKMVFIALLLILVQMGAIIFLVRKK